MAGESLKMKDKHGPTQPALMHSPNPFLIGNPLCNYSLKKTLYLAPMEPNAENMFVIMSLSNDGWLAEVGALAKCLFDLDSHSKHLSRFSFSLRPVCSFYLFVLVQLSFSLSAFDIVIHSHSLSWNNKTMWGSSATT